MLELGGLAELGRGVDTGQVGLVGRWGGGF